MPTDAPGRSCRTAAVGAPDGAAASPDSPYSSAGPPASACRPRRRIRRGSRESVMPLPVTGERRAVGQSQRWLPVPLQDVAADVVPHRSCSRRCPTVTAWNPVSLLTHQIGVGRHQRTECETCRADHRGGQDPALAHRRNATRRAGVSPRLWSLLVQQVQQEIAEGVVVQQLQAGLGDPGVAGQLVEEPPALAPG